MDAYVDTLCFASLYNQKKDTNQFKDKKQPELPENQTAWKSDNQGVKEETFIQTGRRGRVRKLWGEEVWQGSDWQTGRISREEQLGSKTNRTTQGSSTGK